jgi:hypothetical protein
VAAAGHEAGVVAGEPADRFGHRCTDAAGSARRGGDLCVAIIVVSLASEDGAVRVAPRPIPWFVFPVFVNDVDRRGEAMMTVRQFKFEEAIERFSLSEIGLAEVDRRTEGLAVVLVGRSSAPGGDRRSSGDVRTMMPEAPAAFAHMDRRHGPTRCRTAGGDDQAKEVASMSRSSTFVAATSEVAQLRSAS